MFFVHDNLILDKVTVSCPSAQHFHPCVSSTVLKRYKLYRDGEVKVQMSTFVVVHTVNQKQSWEWISDDVSHNWRHELSE